MLLTYKDTSLLKDKEWNVIELRSEKTSEETIKRIGKALPTIFRDDPAEVFIPIGKRDLESFELLTDCYIFVRSLDPKKIVKLRTVTGVVWVVCHGEGTHPNRLIKVDKNYIEDLITKVKSRYQERSKAITKGSFVRILDGHARDFCGIVKNISRDMAYISTDLKTTSMIVGTPIKNLINMNHVPKELRVFYYSEPLKDALDVTENADEYIKTLREDIIGSGNKALEKSVKTIEDSEYLEIVKNMDINEYKKSDVDISSKVKRSNQQMITAFVKNLIQTGDRDVRVIANKTFEAIKQDKIKKPKNIIIAWCVIKYHITKTMYKNDPEIKSYKDVINKYGNSYRISIKELSKMAPWLPVESEDVCTDGRSKKARQNKKKQHNR